VNALPDFAGYFSSSQDRHAYSGPVDFDLSFGLAIFVRKTLSVENVGEQFVYRQKNSIVGTNNATIGRNLQYIQLRLADKPVTVINMHGLWNGQGKTDSPERMEQFRKVRAFVKAINGAVILCGDLNILPTTQSLALLEEDLRNLVKVYGITSTRSQWYIQPDRFADYILVSPDVQVEEFHVLNEEISDHTPLLVTVSG
jgi:endonuclease/exonuclease/phosphatase family metal-dependent hydrolase